MVWFVTVSRKNSWKSISFPDHLSSEQTFSVKKYQFPKKTSGENSNLSLFGSQRISPESRLFHAWQVFNLIKLKNLRHSCQPSNLTPDCTENFTLLFRFKKQILPMKTCNHIHKNYLKGIIQTYPQTLPPAASQLPNSIWTGTWWWTGSSRFFFSTEKLTHELFWKNCGFFSSAVCFGINSFIFNLVIMLFALAGH